MSTISARLDDQGTDGEILSHLESEEKKSEAIRAALREYYDLDTDHNLPDALANVYEALLTITDGGGKVRLSVAKKAVPQFVTHFDQTTIVDAAFRQLEARGYVSPIQRIETVVLYVRPAGATTEIAESSEPNTDDVSLDDEEVAEAILEGNYDVEGSA